MTRPLRPVVVWLVCLLAAIGWISQSIEVSHDLAAFLPDRDRPVENLMMAKANRGAVSRTVLIGFAGAELNQRLLASREAAERLGELKGIERVSNGSGGFDLTAFETLFASRYLLADEATIDASSLRQALEARMRELRSPLGSTAKQTLANDPTASFRTLLLNWSEAHAAPDLEQGLWVTPDRERTLLLAVIEDTDDDLDEHEAIIQAIRKALTELAREQDVELQLAGRPMLIAEAEGSVRSSLIFGSVGAGVLVVTLLVLIYRSLGILFLGILPLLSGIIAGLGAVLLLFGPVHGIALAFGMTLLGITIDYPLHLFSHGEQQEKLTTTAGHLQRPIFLSALTTAFMFAIFGVGSAPGLGQLACFTSVGILIAALTLRFVVPNLADLMKIEPSPRLVELLPAVVPRFLLGVVMIAALGATILLIARHDRLFQADIGVLNPLPEAAKQLDRRLRGDLGASDLRHFLLISGDEAEEVLQTAEILTPALEEARLSGEISGFDTPARYLPSQAKQAERQAALPDMLALKTALEKAKADFPFKNGLFSPFLEDVARNRKSAPLDVKAGQRLFGETPLGAKLDQLLLDHDQHWYGFLPISGVVEITKLGALAESEGNVELVDLKSFSEDLLEDFRAEAFTLLAFGFGAVFLLLLVCRYPPLGIAKILLVLILSVTLTAAILTLIGEGLTLLHILAGLLVVGLGLDYTIFFTWPEADLNQRRRTRHALTICVLSTVLVFGLLALSSIDLLRAIGLTVAIGACTTFAIAYVILSRQDEEL